MSDRHLLVTISMEPQEFDVWAKDEDTAKDNIAVMIGIAGLRALATFTVTDAE